MNTYLITWIRIIKTSSIIFCLFWEYLMDFRDSFFDYRILIYRLLGIFDVIFLMRSWRICSIQTYRVVTWWLLLFENTASLERDEPIQILFDTLPNEIFHWNFQRSLFSVRPLYKQHSMKFPSIVNRECSLKISGKTKKLVFTFLCNKQTYDGLHVFKLRSHASNVYSNRYKISRSDVSEFHGQHCTENEGSFWWKKTAAHHVASSTSSRQRRDKNWQDWPSKSRNLYK